MSLVQLTLRDLEVLTAIVANEPISAWDLRMTLRDMERDDLLEAVRVLVREGFLTVDRRRCDGGGAPLRPTRAGRIYVTGHYVHLDEGVARS